VDDGSRDNTVRVAFDYVRRYSFDLVRVIKQGKNSGKGAAVREVGRYTLSYSDMHGKKLLYSSYVFFCGLSYNRYVSIF
jgi:hypothetical protein